MNGETYLVVGSGISGIGAIRLLERMGVNIFLYDGKADITIEEVESRLPKESTVTCFVREIPKEILNIIDYVVLSPGVPVDIPLVKELHQKGALILGEIELGYGMEKGTLAAITGTNGKTTTTILVGEIMKAYLGEEKVFVVGNIGNPYTAESLKTQEDTVTIGEISSFQLETTHRFKPKVSAILNITPDHLDRHHTMEAYIEAKEAIAANQTKEDICILNYDNVYTKAFGERCQASVVYFSSRQMISNGYYLEGDMICKCMNGVQEVLLNTNTDMKLVGVCNAENVMAAIAITEALGVPFDKILSVIRSFRAVEHRIEFVANKQGVDYYNDSKGTNPDASIHGIKAMNKPTVLIAGGYDKHSTYDQWIESFQGKVKAMVLIGQTKEKIAECARKHGFEPIYFANEFPECLELATTLANQGDAVLLSPACASWGMFQSYEERGDEFKKYVNDLKE